ncbi:major facilitator superfamily domain-containing protein [Pyrenochaeta sp. MPI-SDFR-AT-0127]|nr:major facilitator superfamily domain-containing protein [Pyrenochaeta sp. MPI-SDFR-AT-0127]
MNPDVVTPSSPDCKGRPLDSDLDHISVEVSKIIQVESQHCEIPDEAFLSTEKSLVRKLDSTLMPAVFILYLFNYLDRNNIAQAKLDSLEADLGLTGNDYSVAVSILVVGYILMQLPSNMILTRVRPSLYIPVWVCLWSCVSASTAAVQNFRGLIAIRFVLGITEAPFFPGVFYLLSCWYTKKELALRYAVLYSGLVLATAVSGLLAAGIFSGLDGVAGLAGWRWLFIIEGAASLVLGLCSFFILPDFPGSATGSARWLLSEEERRVSSLRMSLDSVSSQETNHSVWYGLKLAVSDYKVWIFALILCSNQSAYGFNYFYPAIVRGFNLGSRTITLVCTAPPYIIGAVVSYFIAWSSDRRNERGYHICAPMAVAVVGFIVSVSVLNLAARYCASFFYISGVFGANAAVYSWAAFTVGDTTEKKAAATAIINIVGQFGSIWSPYFFDPNDEPRYSRAMILLMAFCALEMLLCLLMKMILRRENKKILARFEGTGNTPTLYML